MTERITLTRPQLVAFSNVPKAFPNNVDLEALGIGFDPSTEEDKKRRVFYEEDVDKIRDAWVAVKPDRRTLNPQEVIDSSKPMEALPPRVSEEEILAELGVEWSNVKLEDVADAAEAIEEMVESKKKEWTGESYALATGLSLLDRVATLETKLERVVVAVDRMTDAVVANGGAVQYLASLVGLEVGDD